MPGSREPNLATLLGLGSTAVVLVLGGTGIGFLIDRRFDSLPVCTLIGLGVGIAVAWVHAYTQLRRFLRK